MRRAFTLIELLVVIAIFLGVRSAAPVGQSVSEPIAAGATPAIDEDPVAPVPGAQPH